MNADKIYSYLLELWLNLHIEPNCNYKNTFYGYKIKCCFHCVLENLVSSRKPNGLAVPNKQIKSGEHFSIPTLPGTATKF